jgi:hypothetical protein
MRKLSERAMKSQTYWMREQIRIREHGPFRVKEAR